MPQVPASEDDDLNTLGVEDIKFVNDWQTKENKTQIPVQIEHISQLIWGLLRVILKLLPYFACMH